MSRYSDTSDVRSLARAILAQEELEQPSMRARVPAYELDPVRPRVVAATRTGFVVGLIFASVCAGDSLIAHQWLLGSIAFSGACVTGATVVGALVGAFAGLVVHWTQRRSLDGELESLTRDAS
jgi:hypothetical protein